MSSKTIKQKLSGAVSAVADFFLGFLLVCTLLVIGLIDAVVRKTPRPRMGWWTLVALLLAWVNYTINPEQFGLMVWKLNLVAIAIVLAYWADRELSPYARPHEFLSCGDATPREAMSRAVLFGFIQISRALVVFAVIHGVTQGV